MSGNNSSTGGFLKPGAPAAPGPLEGVALLDFIQAWIVGLTGLDGTLVRPEGQPEPPNMPPAGTAWCSFRISDRDSDAFPWVGHNPTFLGDAWQPPPNGMDLMQRNETLWLRCIFYDLGSTGQADSYAALMRDSAIIAQNREYLRQGGLTVGSTGELISVTELIKERNQYRVDLAIELRRQIYRAYPVQDILGATVQLNIAGVPAPPGPPLTDDSGAPITGNPGQIITGDGPDQAPLPPLVETIVVTGT
jgi:hypothetical protein